MASRAKLAQQNSMRDAMVAALTLNIFNRHCARLSMANIAQTVNVLQALILTEPDGERMLLTPTYHVFDMFQVHHDVTYVPLELSCEPYSFGEHSMPGISASASRTPAGMVHLTLCNVNPGAPAEIECDVRGMRPHSVRGRVLTAEHMTSHNTLEAPDTVRPAEYTGATVRDGHITATLPPHSVVVLELVPAVSAA